MGRNESTVELLVNVWKGMKEFLLVPNESTGSLFRHMRVMCEFQAWFPPLWPGVWIGINRANVFHFPV